MSASWRQSEKRIEFKNSDGNKLVGILNPAPTQKTVILCHGYTDHKDTRLNLKLCEKFHSIPLATFRFDFSGNGESEGEFDLGKYWKELGDIRSAVQCLRDQGLDVYGLIGHSKGGSLVLLYASRYDDIPFVINLCGRLNMKVGLELRFGCDIFDQLRVKGKVEAPRKLPGGGSTTYMIKKETVDEMLKIDMREEVKKIKKSRVLTIHGTNDCFIPCKDAEDFDSIIMNHELHILEDADHCFTNEDHASELVDVSVRFLRRFLDCT